MKNIVLTLPLLLVASGLIAALGSTHDGHGASELGVTLPWHYHPVINAAVILQGNLELQLTDGRKKIYQESDALIEVVNTIHSGKALGSQAVNVVVVYAGEKGVPTTLLTKP